jgi:hypothetical protein
MNLGLEKIRIDCGTQARAQINQDVVTDYTEALKNGAQFPDITVYFDGVSYYLADGFHRYLAAKAAGSPNISTTIINGTLRDAVLFSVGANFDHGLHRTNADKRKAVEMMVQDLEWGDWSDREIAKQCHVSNHLVAQVRKELGMVKDEVKFERAGKTHVAQKKDPKQEPAEEELKDLVAEFANDDNDTMHAAMEMLQAENIALSDKLAVASLDGDEIAKQLAESTIKDLRAQIRLLEIELKAVIQSRDSFQAENAQLKKQVASVTKKLRKFEDDGK